MRGIVSVKLEPFLAQVNCAIAEAKLNNIKFSPELVRANLEKLSVFLTQSPSLASVEDRVLKTQGRHIPVRIYDPAPKEKLPVLLHFHGGGHMCGSVELYDPISRQLAKVTRCIVICVEYRLAPEYPYPAGIDDCEYALLHYQDVLSGYEYNDRIYIVGDSAGGAICATLSMKSVINPAIKIDKQVLIYPSVDYSTSTVSITENGAGFLLEKDKIQWYFQQYFQENVTNINFVKQASPLCGPFSADMPETLVITAGCDPLRDEGIAYANALIANGVVVKHYSFDGMIHAFMLLESLVSDECQQTYELIGDFLA